MDRPFQFLVDAAPAKHIDDEDVTSVSRFSTVSDGQDHDLFGVVVIQRDIGSVPELNHPLAEFRWQLFDRTADPGMLGQLLYPLPDRLDRALGRLPALRSQKVVESRHIQQGWLRPP